MFGRHLREDLDAPIPTGLPEEELIRRILSDHYMAECNDAMARMYGLASAQEFVGKRLTEMLDPNDPRNIELTREFIRSGFRVIDRESREVDIHGNPKIFLNSLIGIVEDGKLLRTWGIQRDITDCATLEEARQNAVKALEAREAHFRILVEQASDGIFIADAQGKYLDVNSAGAEMLGYTREEILESSISNIIAPDEIARVAGELAILSGGDTVRSEWQFRRKDASLFPGEVAAKRLLDGRVQGILRDMTERKQAEEALRRSEARFRVALQNSPVCVFSMDCDLRYIWIYNPHRFLDASGSIGKTDAEILGDRAAQLTDIQQQVLQTGLGSRNEVSIPANGEQHHFDITLEPVRDAAGQITGITGAAMDVARLRQLADCLQKSKDKLVLEKHYLETQIQSELGFEEIVGQSACLKDVLKDARVVAPTNATVLLLGETGTGKELIARSIHALSTRRESSFIKLNCAAVPVGLLESELFGHEKGAFTGAVTQKVGRLELADRGTLFLDEIGELPLELQPKLLRVLQDQEFERLGGIRTLRVDARIIAATNRDLLKDIGEKKFREDLFYRLHVFPIHLPALRERRSDIPHLAAYFLQKHAARMGKRIESIPQETLEFFAKMDWPGNIRELENLVERLVILTNGPILALLPEDLRDVTEIPAAASLEGVTREYIMRVLQETNGVLSGPDGAAARLGLKRTTLQSMLKRYDIDLNHYRGGQIAHES